MATQGIVIRAALLFPVLLLLLAVRSGAWAGLMAGLDTALTLLFYLLLVLTLMLTGQLF